MDLRKGVWVIWQSTAEMEDGWCWGSTRDQQGLFPKTYIDAESDYSGASLLHRAELSSQGFAPSFRLAGGGTCNVFDIHLPDGTQVAAKVLHHSESRALACAMLDQQQLFEREVDALRRINHPNIVHMLDAAMASSGAFVIIEEFASQTSLTHCLSGLERRQRVIIATQVAYALCYIHQQGIVHRDMKSANILVNADAVANVTAVKISDFGLAMGAWVAVMNCCNIFFEYMTSMLVND